MPAIKTVPLSASLASAGAAFQSPNINAKQRLAILVQAKLVLLNYKGGTNYIANHTQLTKDAELAYIGLTPEAWGAGLGNTTFDFDPGAETVGQYVQQANFRDSTNMSLNVNTIMTVIGLQMARTPLVLQKQNIFVDLELLAIWG
jgi:hypothetical protein